MVRCKHCKGRGTVPFDSITGVITYPACNGTGTSFNSPPSELENREQVFDRLLDLVVRYLDAQDARSEVEYKEQVFQLLKDNRDVDYNFDL